MAAASPQIVMGRSAPVLLAFPIGEGGPRQRRSGALVYRRLETHFPTYLSYRYPHPTSAPSGHLLPMEGGSIHASPFLWKGLPSAARRGWLPFSAAKPLPLCLPHWGRGTASAVDRVLSLIADLRRISSLFFIPLVPYPARSARHLPLEGKALFVRIVFPHMHVFALTMREKRYSRFVAFPIGEGGPRQRWIGCSR